MDLPRRIAVIGLGYVGLPLAVELAKHFAVTGFDRNAARIAELAAGEDRTREVAPEDLRATGAEFTDREADLAGCDLYIVTVPTPVGDDKKPDLSAVEAASRTVGGALAKGATVVLESTVYPGVTEEVVGRIVAEVSGLACGTDFFLGYSPERMNPGDREHSLTRLTKVVAGQTPEVTEMLRQVYAKVTNVFVASGIRTAEAAKVIENAQRDINIAFVNEVAMIFNKLGLSVHEVLEAARTKWNFLPFSPGLVGGHCIGVDPYYLAYKSEQIGHHPEVILAGRHINDTMGQYIAEAVDAVMREPGRVLVLGLTFKEDVPDLRNSLVATIVRRFEALGHDVDVHDPLADPEAARQEYGIALSTDFGALEGYDAVLGAVAHSAFKSLTQKDFSRLLAPGGVLADVKGMWRDVTLPEGYRRWQL
jgi:UDP-N-acetyl-D-galactosamine dehydrogenase